MRTIVLLALTYVISTMLSNVSSLRIIRLFGLSMDAGTLLYPITFTLRDLIHKKAGQKFAVFTIWAGAFFNAAMFLMFFLVASLPADLSVGKQAGFGQVLLPSWRIIVGSLVAMVVAELIDSQVYQWYVNRVKNYQWGRVLVSNFISIPLDTAIMVVIAFYGTIPDAVLWGVILSNIIIKYGITLLSLPLIYFVKKPGPAA
ncbi:hypothetical protein EDC14_100252 [Hydrogenispora ethanolica]|jgi:uncharacterized integral membrane protein (TIGR00697 family)|uniref:Queuosine precursor transporter n=1 Tax=Hydrogenispora ethanolica TaxID=1082276 RepID=A0A4R1SAC1_HYDET|nr:queuosine precursor transporter [Hydrogenispora ethanolica]TCL76299.1 hypothetical protein EDC14_100252 [Hydrogenispora ethanolica]